MHQQAASVHLARGSAVSQSDEIILISLDKFCKSWKELLWHSGSLSWRHTTTVEEAEVHGQKEGYVINLRQ